MAPGDGVGTAVEWEEEGAGGKELKFFCDTVERGEGGSFWVGFFASFLDFREGVGERAGTLALDVDASMLGNEGATGFAAAGDIVGGSGGFEVEPDCLRDDGPARWFLGEGEGILPLFSTGLGLNDLTPSVLAKDTLVGDEGSIPGSLSIDPEVTESREKQDVGHPKKRGCHRASIPCPPIHTLLKGLQHHPGARESTGPPRVKRNIHT